MYSDYQPVDYKVKLNEFFTLPQSGQFICIQTLDNSIIFSGLELEYKYGENVIWKSKLVTKEKSEFWWNELGNVPVSVTRIKVISNVEGEVYVRIFHRVSIS